MQNVQASLMKIYFCPVWMWCHIAMQILSHIFWHFGMKYLTNAKNWAINKRGLVWKNSPCFSSQEVIKTASRFMNSSCDKKILIKILILITSNFHILACFWQAQQNILKSFQAMTVMMRFSDGEMFGVLSILGIFRDILRYLLSNLMHFLVTS